MLFIDCEVYRNYFLLCVKNSKTGGYAYYQMHDNVITGQIKDVEKLMRKNTTSSFNGLNYDLPILVKLLSGASNSKIKTLSDKIIKSSPAWMTLKEENITIPPTWDHIDLFELPAGKHSLKIYGGRLGMPTIQDLPIEPDETIDFEQAEQLREYCKNDLDTTEALYYALDKQIKLRESMGELYRQDLRSKSDAKIAESVLKSEHLNMTGSVPKRQDTTQTSFKYKDPGIISFESETLRLVYDNVMKCSFELGKNGTVEIPGELKVPIFFADATYRMGNGGLHSCEKRQCVRADELHGLCDWDVASYYPNIILQQNISPPSMNETFTQIYKDMLETRLHAKSVGDSVMSDTLKICVNGTYGKLGSTYSFLYAPNMLIQTTITGQLALLMLIERMEFEGIPVVSANTDGIVCNYPRELEERMKEVVWEWMLDTSFELERSEYTLVASRDVNNYVAIQTNGKVKGKGVFANSSLNKNPAFPIVYTAVKKYCQYEIPVETTIRECEDLKQFCSVRTVKGGAVWQGEKLGKTVRFYYSCDVGNEISIHYATNANKVPLSQGVRPAMTLPDTFPPDVDYTIYIDMAKKLLGECDIVRKTDRDGFGQESQESFGFMREVYKS